MRAATTHGDWLIIFAKKPAPGRSKTRIAEEIGEEAACELAEAFLIDTLETAAGLVGLRVLISYAPAEGRSWFAERAPDAALFPQPETDFGARMVAAVDEAFRHGARRCVMMGMDTPHLEPERIESAFDALERADVCLGPSEDGGYYLIGLREREPGLFADVPWSTSQVHAVTLQRAAAACLKAVDLETELDVDLASDLPRLRALLDQRPRVGRASRVALERLARRGS